MIGCTELSNHEPYNVIVSNITNITLLFFCLLEAAFKIHLAQKSEGATCPLTLNGHNTSDYRHPAVGTSTMTSITTIHWILKSESPITVSPEFHEHPLVWSSGTPIFFCASLSMCIAVYAVACGVIIASLVLPRLLTITQVLCSLLGLSL